MSEVRAEDGDIDAICFELDGTLCTGMRPSVDGFETDAIADGLRQRYLGDRRIKPSRGAGTDRTVADEGQTLRDRWTVDPVPGAEDVLETLADEYRLGVVTNGAPELQRAKLEAADLDDYVETVVCGGYETPAKPAPEPFEVALEALDARPDRAAYVGNSLSSDVAGARAAGLQSVWIPRSEDVPDRPEPTPAYTLENLRELATPPW